MYSDTSVITATRVRLLCMHVRALREVYVVESVVYDVMFPLALACGI